MQNSVRLFLIESQNLVRIGIKTVLSAENDLEIVGEAETSAKGFELLKQTHPMLF